MLYHHPILSSIYAGMTARIYRAQNLNRNHNKEKAMSTNQDPIQLVEQEVLSTADTIVEEINQEVPTLATIPWELKNQLAGKIWLDSGGIPDDPNTLNNWLLAESTLISRTPATYNG
jgi:hypothetical protein